MPGAMIGILGKQRSGKTLMAYKLAKGLQESAIKSGLKLPVYTNLWCPKDEMFSYVNSINELPLDLTPKIVLIDEIYNGCDAQDYRKLKDISIFINTLGKQNCLFLFTSIDASMVYNRIRSQTNLVILVKANSEQIHYKLVFTDSLREVDYCVKKEPDFFQNVNYDTNFIPLDFNWEMKGWRTKLTRFYKENYGITVSFE